MRLGKKTLEELRKIINGDDTFDYRSGPQLVTFFNGLGFSDAYGQGFPSCWAYTDSRLDKINGTPELDKCLREIFAPINYIGRIEELDELIAGFNKYLAFDKWKIIRENESILFKRLDRVIIDESPKTVSEMQDTDFLKLTYDVDIDKLGLGSGISDIIKARLTEVESCISHDAPLAAVIMIGSIMEGILLGIASSHPKAFNQAASAPKDQQGKNRKFHDWKLNNYIDVASEIGILKPDVKKFSHVVRDFRNYIHPYQQMATQFAPDKHTAMICLQVLKAAIYQIGQYQAGGTNEWIR